MKKFVRRLKIDLTAKSLTISHKSLIKPLDA